MSMNGEYLTISTETALTDAQTEALRAICERYNVPFNPEDFKPAFGLPSGYVGGWVGGDKIYIGCAPDGAINS